MSQLIIAAFRSRDDTNMAIDALESAGYAPKDISVITKDTRTSEIHADDHHVGSGAVSGATTGGVIGGLAGLLAGAGVFPALAGLLIGGPIAAALGLAGVAATTVSGAFTGAVAGTLIGALTGLGLPEETAQYYQETIDSGGYVVAVPVDSYESLDAKDILSQCGADRMEQLHIGENTNLKTTSVV